MIRHLIAGSLRVFSGSVANHTSNIDGPVLWISLPPPVRAREAVLKLRQLQATSAP